MAAGPWQSRFVVPAAAVGLFLEALEPEGVSVAAFEEAPADAGEPAARWRIEILHEHAPDQRALAERLAPLAERAGIGRIDLTVAPLPDADWLARTATAFPPQQAGRFWIRGSHVEAEPPPGSTPILIDAGLAFGSGEHPTTRLCLAALDRLARHRRFRRVLDLGCGSGILAIAAAKCWPARVVAADDDPSAVAVARANAEHNGVARHVRCVRSHGLEAPAVRLSGPYDLILANILADPLAAMARDVRRHLAPEGLVVLSGLLGWQTGSVLGAYRRAGLRPVAELSAGPWQALALSAEKPFTARIIGRWLRRPQAAADPPAA